MAKGKQRLDDELFRQGLYPSKDSAMRGVLAGDVSCEGKRLEHPGMQVKIGAPLHVKGQSRYVSRGGLKLEGALRSFGLSAEGKACLDVGCSTGGFTDCLLKHGAARVSSVDVGRAQFDWGLRNDPRVTLLENTNICGVDPLVVGAPFDLVVADVSFTSVERILDAVISLMGERAVLCTLVKPQFEAAREEVGEGGIVRDPSVHERVLTEVVSRFSSTPLGVRDVCVSPIHGAKGNREFFLLAVMGEESLPIDVKSVVAKAWEDGDPAGLPCPPS